MRRSAPAATAASCSRCSSARASCARPDRRPAAPRSPDHRFTYSRTRSMASGSLILFYAGAICLAVAFMAYVAHAVLLANRRLALPALVLAPAAVPVYAGVATGSFVERRHGRATASPAALNAGARTAAAPFASAFTVVAILLLGLSMAMRAVIVG